MPADPQVDGGLMVGGRHDDGGGGDGGVGGGVGRGDVGVELAGFLEKNQWEQRMVESWVEVRVEAENIPKAEKAVATAVTVLATCYSLIVSILSSTTVYLINTSISFLYSSSVHLYLSLYSLLRFTYIFHYIGFSPLTIFFTLCCLFALNCIFYTVLSLCLRLLVSLCMPFSHIFLTIYRFTIV
jgi:hypothetical protein